MANTYYCVVLNENSKYLPGVYTFEDDAHYGLWGNHTMLVHSSHWVVKEAEYGAICIKDKLTGSRLPRKLTPDELKEFMWVKLRARNI